MNTKFLGAVVALLLIIVGVYFIFNGRAQAPTNTNTATTTSPTPSPTPTPTPASGAQVTQIKIALLDHRSRHRQVARLRQCRNGLAHGRADDGAAWCCDAGAVC